MFENTTPGTQIIISLTDGSTIKGSFISVNSKGVNVKDENGKTISRSLTRVEGVEEIDIDDLIEELDDTDVATEDSDVLPLATEVEVTTDAEDSDVLTTREVADIFNMEAKDLRVVTRQMGLSVGKGKRYAFTSENVDAIRAYLTEMAEAEAADAAEDLISA